MAVARAEAAEEARIGDDAALELGDYGSAGRGGRRQREAEEDLREYVLVLQRGGRRRRGAAAAATRTAGSRQTLGVAHGGNWVWRESRAVAANAGARQTFGVAHGGAQVKNGRNFYLTVRFTEKITIGLVFMIFSKTGLGRFERRTSFLCK